MFFFLQAEDGIRDLVRSRGLGDVYKRQIILLPRLIARWQIDQNISPIIKLGAIELRQHLDPVSYTHLTLPTSDLV